MVRPRIGWKSCTRVNLRARLKASQRKGIATSLDRLARQQDSRHKGVAIIRCQSWQRDAIEVAASVLASEGVEGWGDGRGHVAEKGRVHFENRGSRFRLGEILHLRDTGGRQLRKSGVVLHGQRVDARAQCGEINVHEFSSRIPGERTVAQAHSNRRASIRGKCADRSRVLLTGYRRSGNKPTAVRRYGKDVKNRPGDNLA